MNIKIVKGDLNGGRLMLTPEWATNSLWAARRRVLANAPAEWSPAAVAAVLRVKPDQVEERLTLDMGKHVLPSVDLSALVMFKRTGWHYKLPPGQYGTGLCMTEQAMYQAEDGRKIYLDRRYADGLGGVFSGQVWACDVLKPVVCDACGDKPASVEEVDFILMPMRSAVPGEDEARQAAEKGDK
ncbi:MAG: hypothetical protein RQ748_09900 [Elusimicrobiales bacterium]|nr:hypothetical protein [Elusimicrobiales bacterium]